VRASSATRAPVSLAKVLFACGLLAAAFVGACNARDDRPNVLLISIDSLRADHLGCYGYARATSPALDRLARDGALFQNHCASTSWTLPSHAALFTSLPDGIHGCTDSDRALDGSAPTLAERFRGAGYATAGFFSGPFLHPVFGFGRGFQSYEDCTSYGALTNEIAPETFNGDGRLDRAAHSDVTGPRIFAALERWFTGRPKRPFFLFVHLWDVHYDYIPPPPFDKEFDPDYTGAFTGVDFFWNSQVNPGMDPRDLQHLVALYDGEIAWTDTFVGKIRELLETRGLLDDTVVAVTSDHGDEFFEHGQKTHRRSLYDEVTHVPLVLRFPRRVRAGTTLRAQTRSIDVGPTLLELAGLPAPSDVLGASLLPLVNGPPDAPGRPAVSELYTRKLDLRSVRTLRWKFVDDLRQKRSFFFDLEHDPTESIPRADFGSELGKEARAGYEREFGALTAFAAAHPSIAAASSSGGPKPAAIQSQLKKFGYVDGEEESAPTKKDK